jgi:CRP/FNR family transcriptional regulator
MTLVGDRTDLVARIPLFHGVSHCELANLVAHSQERHCRPGQTLFCEGDPCTGLFLLLSGRLKICKTSTSGREVALSIETAPSSIAEVPLFDDGPYPATAYAVDDATLLLIERSRFRGLCFTHPEVPCRILADIGRRVRSMVELIDSLTFGGVRQQLARLLLSFRQEAGDDTLLLPISTQEMAMRLGTAREVVSRNLSRLQADGLISLHKRHLVILDADALAREAVTEL